MINEEDETIITWSGTSKKWFEDKGYEYTKLGEAFTVKIKDLAKGSNFLIPYTCDYCNESFSDKSYCNLLKQRKHVDKDVCMKKECKTKKRIEVFFVANPVEYEDSLEYRYPLIAKEWDYAKNGLSLPIEVHHGSGKKVWWLCEKGHEWEDLVGVRTRHGTVCKSCQREKHNLANTFPLIAKEWHPTLNGELEPRNVSPKNARSVWWICEKGHEWEATVHNRTFHNSQCPCCSNRTVCLDNCLATVNPELSLEWNYLKNNESTPYDVTKYSNKIVWWICSKCNHEWQASVDSRNGKHKTGCPTCNESKGEKRIRYWLECNNIVFNPQKEFDGLIGLGGKNLSYDFYLPYQNLLIEYQGEFHDGSGNEYTRMKLAYQQEHDRRKREYAECNKIELLEIWHWDFDNIEGILNSKLDKYIGTFK